MHVDGQDIEPELNSPQVNHAVSFVARVPAVREMLVAIPAGLTATMLTSSASRLRVNVSLHKCAGVR